MASSFVQVVLVFALTGTSYLVRGGSYQKDCSSVYPFFPDVYMIQPDGAEPFAVRCTFDSNGGWTVVQNNVGGGQWGKTFSEYQAGFGSNTATEDYWLGLDFVNQITTQHEHRHYELRVDLEHTDGSTVNALYRNFLVANSDSAYFLTYGDFVSSEGSADGLGTVHRGARFSTKDKDNDAIQSKNCGDLKVSGWWFNGGDCNVSNLNTASINWNGIATYIKATMSIRAY